MTGLRSRTCSPRRLGLIVTGVALLVAGCGAAGAASGSGAKKAPESPVVRSRSFSDASETRRAARTPAPTAAGPTPTLPHAAVPSARTVDADQRPAPAVPVVTISAISDGTASESDDRPCSNMSAASLGRGELEIRRTGAVSTPLTVRYTTAGTASPGDFESLPGEITIPAGASTASVLVTPSSAHAPPPLHLHRSSSLVLTLAESDGYDVGDAASAEIALRFDFDVFGCEPPPPTDRTAPPKSEQLPSGL